MSIYDWAALVLVLGFLRLGRPGGHSRRARVVALCAVFAALYAIPWVTSRDVTGWVSPFRFYSLYSTPAPASFHHGEARLVLADGSEAAIDARAWQPFIPGFFNVQLSRAIDSQPTDQQWAELGEALLEIATVGVDAYHASGAFHGQNGYLLGPLAYPEHQTSGRRWTAASPPPAIEAIVGLRIYRVEITRPRGSSTPDSTAVLLWETPQ